MTRFAIDPRSNVPPSEQLAERVRFAVAAGEFAEGDRLPSVRSLASDALVNPNTVAKAYRALEWDGVVATRPGDGIFVAPGARGRCRSARDRALRERLARLLREAREAGLGDSDLWDWVQSALPRRSAEVRK